MFGWDWTAIGTLVALSLGLLSVWFGYVLPLRRERAAAKVAKLSVRYEYYWRRDTARMQERLVVRNHGPHVAEDVEVLRLLDTGLEAMDPHAGAVTPLDPAPILQPLDEWAAILEWSLADRTAIRADIGWRDGEGWHESSFSLSPFYV